MLREWETARMARLTWIAIVIAGLVTADLMDSFIPDNGTNIINLGILADLNNSGVMREGWTTSGPFLDRGKERVLLKIALNIDHPFIVNRQVHGITQLSNTLFLSGLPHSVNATLRLLGDTIDDVTVFHSLTTSPSHFCRVMNTTTFGLKNARRSLESLLIDQRPSLGPEPKWVLLPMYCYHVTPIEPILSLLSHLQWQSFIIITDPTTDEVTDTLLSQLSSLEVKISHDRIDATSSNGTIKELLLYYYSKRNMNKPNFLLLCGEELVQRIFSMVQQMDADRTTAMFLYASWVTVSSTDSLAKYERWIDDMSNVLVLTLKSGLNPAILGGGIHGCEIDAVLWATRGRRGTLNMVGHWSHVRGLHIQHPPFPNFGFNNFTFTVGVLEWQPFIMDNKNGTYSGLSVVILEELASVLNFSYTFVTPRDGSWGDLLENGSRTGFMKDLLEGVMDFAIAPLAATESRLNILNFTQAYYYDYNVILVRKETSDNNWRLVVDIFSWPVILCTVAAVPLTAVLIYALEFWNPFPFPKTYNPRGFRRYGQLIWYTYGALLSQGGSNLPASQAGRTQVAFWWLFSIMLTATFSGNLIAFLTVPKSVLPFYTLEDMVEQTDFTWGMVDGTVLSRFLQKTNISTLNRVWHGRDDDLSTDIEAHVNRVLTENHAYLGGKSESLFYMANHCDLAIARDEFYPMKYAFTLPKGSPYNEIFSRKMRQLVEGGLIGHWRKRWWPVRRNCPAGVPKKAKKMTLGDVQSAFYLLLIGIGLGSLAITCEKILTLVSSPNQKGLPRKVSDQRTSVRQHRWSSFHWLSSFFNKEKNNSVETNVVSSDKVEKPTGENG